MSRPLTKSNEKAMINDFREVTGANAMDAVKYMKKFRFNLSQAVNGYFTDAPSTSDNSQERQLELQRERLTKIGNIWERFKDPANPKLITIDGTLEFCEELGIDPSSDSVLFCLAADLGSRTTGEWEKEPFVTGWLAMYPNLESMAELKAHLPTLRNMLNSNPEYFKRVYMHTFDLAKAPGSRTLGLDTAIDMWTLFLSPALVASPSALSPLPSNRPDSDPALHSQPAFGEADLEMWLQFQRQRGKAVSKDTWSLLIDFIRSIDAAYEDYDEEAAWPSTIDDFVAFVRAKKA